MCIMKKLVLFLSLCVTNIVYGSPEGLNKALNTLNTVLEEIKNKDRSVVSEVAKNILLVAIDISDFEDTNKNPVLAPCITYPESSDISTLVAMVIQRFVKDVEKDNSLMFIINMIFKAFESTSDQYLESLLVGFIGSPNENNHAKAVLRAFQASLYINYHLFILKEDLLQQHEQYVKRVAACFSKIYSNRMDYLLMPVTLFCKTAQKINELSSDPLPAKIMADFFKAVISNILVKGVSQEEVHCSSVDIAFRKLFKKEKLDSLKKVAKNMAVFAGLLGSGYYISEKTEQGKKLKKLSKDHQKTAITLGGLATILGAALIYNSVNN